MREIPLLFWNTFYELIGHFAGIGPRFFKFLDDSFGFHSLIIIQQWGLVETTST
jgi:hypothetical protein